MLQTENQFYKLILMFILVLLIPAAIADVQVIIGAQSTVLMIIEAVVMIVSLISAFVYILKGYSKNMAKVYKVFMYSFLLAEVLGLIASLTIDIATGALPIVLGAIIIIAIALLAFIKDFGKTNSFITAAILLAASFVSYFTGAGAHPGVVRGGEDIINTSIGLLQSTTVLLSFVVGFLVIAKYVDKTARGTK